MLNALFRRKSKKKTPLGEDFNLVADPSAQSQVEPHPAANPLVKSTTPPQVHVPGNPAVQPTEQVVAPTVPANDSAAQPTAAAAPAAPPAPVTVQPISGTTASSTSGLPTAFPATAAPAPAAPAQPAIAQPAPTQPATTQPVPASPAPAPSKNGAPPAGPPIAATQSIVRPHMVRTARGGPPLIRLDDVTKAYETPTGPFLALKDIHLQIGKGEFVAVVGKSGSGKSTLINMITGIDRPTTGEIHIADTPIHNLGEGPMAEWRGRNVGVIFQFFQLLPMLTCVENVMLPMDFCNMYRSGERRKRALDLLSMVEMADQADKLPSEVSGGQQQRVAIARALSNDPPVIVADEPTGNLDSKTADAVFQMFERLIQNGKTILMVTHDDELAGRVTRRITIADGIIVGEEQLR